MRQARDDDELRRREVAYIIIILNIYYIPYIIMCWDWESYPFVMMWLEIVVERKCSVRNLGYPYLLLLLYL